MRILLLNTLRALLFTFLIAVVPITALTCSILYPERQTVSSQFQVDVLDRGKPVAGLHLVIRDGFEKRIATATTDSHGVALFNGIPVGNYEVGAELDGFLPDFLPILVRTEPAAGKILRMDWPHPEPLKVRYVRGQIRGPDYYPTQSQVPLSLSLLDGRTGSVLTSASTDNHGAFQFVAVPPGIYFVRLSPSGLKAWSKEQIEGLITVELDPSAPNDSLSLDLGWSSCGLSYADDHECIQQPLEADNVCGRVLDPQGLPIAKAQVDLFDIADPKSLQKLSTDENGLFAFKPMQGKSFNLLIIAPGFNPLYREVHIRETQPARGCDRTIHVELGLFNKCSRVVE